MDSPAMEDSPKLTARQQQVLDLVQSAIERTGAPPTRAEIAAELGFKSANAAEEHLQALARKGVIELVGGTSRGIRLKSDTLRAMAEARLAPWGQQYMLPLPHIAQMTLPLVGRVAAGSPILAQEHVDQTYLMEAAMWVRRPDYLLKVKGMSMRDAGILDAPERDQQAPQTSQEFPHHLYPDCPPYRDSQQAPPQVPKEHRDGRDAPQRSPLAPPALPQFPTSPPENCPVCPNCQN